LEKNIDINYRIPIYNQIGSGYLVICCYSETMSNIIYTLKSKYKRFAVSLFDATECMYGVLQYTYYLLLYIRCTDGFALEWSSNSSSVRYAIFNLISFFVYNPGLDTNEIYNGETWRGERGEKQMFKQWTFYGDIRISIGRVGKKNPTNKRFLQQVDETCAPCA